MIWVVAGGRRFHLGQVVVSRESGIEWVITGVLPDYYGKGRNHNLVTVRRPDNPGIANVLHPEDILVHPSNSVGR